ncbi:hypothetical protein [Pseudonocardia sp. TRM90224]|uniref:hypothetical protein n=1 Tax=Pseudonocardia sp. TRM90224 TaxID=2812678 RepID=UPI001E396628|nr:hypothetical protein [Pseudonocardia sp. TRM90224]
MLEVLGILMIVQGIGGFINNWVDGSPSWFLVNYIPALNGFELPASAALAVAGFVIAGIGERSRKQRKAA